MLRVSGYDSHRQCLEWNEFIVVTRQHVNIHVSRFQTHNSIIIPFDIQIPAGSPRRGKFREENSTIIDYVGNLLDNKVQDYWTLTELKKIRFMAPILWCLNFHSEY